MQFAQTAASTSREDVLGWDRQRDLTSTFLEMTPNSSFFLISE